MQTINDYLSLLKELIAFFDELKDVEIKKAVAVNMARLDELDECMKKEQAFLLKIRGIEKKRELIQKELGFDNKTFKEIIASPIDEAVKKSLSSLYGELEDKISQYKKEASNAEELIKEHLSSIDDAIKNLSKQKAADPSGYQSDGQKGDDEPKSFTSRRV